MSARLDELIQKVQGENIKVVSFDIFDTLLVRPVVQPTDLFKIIANRGNLGSGFPQKRISAEKQARLNKPFNVDDITLSEIYRNYATLYSVSEEYVKHIQNLELEVEFHYLQARKSLKKVLETALQANKEVIITSDMYLPKSFLEKVLDKCEIRGYSHLYLSCDCKMAKGTGKLYEKIISDYEKKGIPAKQILHIGDNLFADIEKAEQSGILSAHVPSAISAFSSKRMLGNMIKGLHNSLDNSFMIGYLANSLFDDPFEDFASYSVFNGKISLMGKIIFAPLLLSFSKWMLEDCQKEQISKILFVYRDGYLPQKIIQLLQPLYESKIDSDIIYLSRLIRNNYYAKEQEGLMKSISDLPVYPEMTIENFAKKRLFINSDTKTDIWNKFAKYGYKSKKDSIGVITEKADLLNELESDFHKNTFSNIEVIDDYCKSKIRKGKIAVFDVGYRGSVSQFLKRNFDTDNIGYQIFATPLVNNCSLTNIKTFVPYGFSTINETTILHSLIEDIISIDEGSSINIKRENYDYKIVKKQKSPSPELAEIQASILEYISGFLKLFGKDICNLTFDNYLHFELLVEFLKKPCQMDAEVIKNMIFVDSDFVSMPDYNIYENWYGRFFALQSKKVSHFRSICYNWLRVHNFLKYVRPIYIKLKDSIQELSLNTLKSKITFKVNKRMNLKKTFFNQSISALQEVKQADLLTDTDNILVCGDIVSYDKGICNFLNRASKNTADKIFVLISEATWVTDENTKKKIHFPFFMVPEFLAKNRYLSHGRVRIDNATKIELQKREYLRWAVENLKERHNDMTKGYAEIWAVNAYNYYCQIFDILHPSKIIIWNQFHALHHIIEGVAREKNIEIIYMEFGSIPGTFALENTGQMGESFPARHADEFMKKKVSENEISCAGDILNYLKSSKLNRNIQVHGNLNLLKNKIKLNRPIIFYAGQNDYESGISPYTENTLEFHSPVFKSSDEAACFLAQLAKKNDWNIIYKPHPIMTLIGKKAKNIPRNVIVIDSFDINELIDFADITITILSQTAYIALIREKPVCMLGYTQLKGKGCTYEAFEKEIIEEKISAAIQDGYIEEMRDNFKKHTAQMLKYALYDDMLERDIRYGQDIKRAEDFIYK